MDTFLSFKSLCGDVPAKREALGTHSCAMRGVSRVGEESGLAFENAIS